MGRGRRESRRRIHLSLLGVTIFGATACASVEAAQHPETVETTEPPSTTEAVTVSDVATGELDEPVEISVGGREGVQVVFREIVLPPGARTGEHCHHGQLVAVVEQGELTHYAPVYPDGVHVYHEDDAIIEGPGYVHEGVNEGEEDVVLWVTYLIEADEPLAETDLTRCER